MGFSELNEKLFLNGFGNIFIWFKLLSKLLIVDCNDLGEKPGDKILFTKKSAHGWFGYPVSIIDPKGAVPLKMPVV